MIRGDDEFSLDRPNRRIDFYGTTSIVVYAVDTGSDDWGGRLDVLETETVCSIRETRSWRFFPRLLNSAGKTENATKLTVDR